MGSSKARLSIVDREVNARIIRLTSINRVVYDITSGASKTYGRDVLGRELGSRPQLIRIFLKP